MKAVILAAGRGSRLRPTTDAVPKCMVPVNGLPTIDKQVENLLANGVRAPEVCVVAGYKHEVLEKHLSEKFPGVAVVVNGRYAETNNMYSLSLAAPFLAGRDFLLMNGDVFFDGCILAGMAAAGNANLIACDRSVYFAESMKITVAGGRVTRISKAIPEKDAYAVSIDVYRFSGNAGERLFAKIDETMRIGKDENSWTEAAIDGILSETAFAPHPVDGRWVEIDDREDLARAESVFAGA